MANDIKIFGGIVLMVLALVVFISMRVRKRKPIPCDICNGTGASPHVLGRACFTCGGTGVIDWD